MEEGMSCHSLTKKSIRDFMVLAFVAVSGALFAEEDDHYIQSDDYFISKEPYKPTVDVRPACQNENSASAETKNEANSCRLATGTMCGPKTTGRHALQPSRTEARNRRDRSGCDGRWRSISRPENKEEARTSSWFMAKITDLSDSTRATDGFGRLQGRSESDTGCHRKMPFLTAQSHERMMLTASPPSGGDAAVCLEDSRRAQNTHLRENNDIKKTLRLVILFI
jgi:hypothetical protein